MAQSIMNSSPNKVGWRVKEWYEAAGLKAAYTFELIRDKRIRSVKVDGARIILTSPAEFLAQFEEDAPL